MSETDRIPKAKLILSAGGTLHREFPIQQAHSLIGRWDPDVDVHPQIDLSDEDLDFNVSRRHATIDYHNSGFSLTDYGSRNGTSLNRQRLEPHRSYLLKNGDEVTIGSLFFRFFISEPSP